jgi:hypothetical protein
LKTPDLVVTGKTFLAFLMLDTDEVRGEAHGPEYKIFCRIQTSVVLMKFMDQLTLIQIAIGFTICFVGTGGVVLRKKLCHPQLWGQLKPH